MVNQASNKQASLQNWTSGEVAGKEKGELGIKGAKDAIVKLFKSGEPLVILQTIKRVTSFILYSKASKIISPISTSKAKKLESEGVKKLGKINNAWFSLKLKNNSNVKLLADHGLNIARSKHFGKEDSEARNLLKKGKPTDTVKINSTTSRFDETKPSQKIYYMEGVCTGTALHWATQANLVKAMGQGSLEEAFTSLAKEQEKGVSLEAAANHALYDSLSYRCPTKEEFAAKCIQDCWDYYKSQDKQQKTESKNNEERFCLALANFLKSDNVDPVIKETFQKKLQEYQKSHPEVSLDQDPQKKLKELTNEQNLINKGKIGEERKELAKTCRESAPPEEKQKVTEYTEKLVAQGVQLKTIQEISEKINVEGFSENTKKQLTELAQKSKEYCTASMKEREILVQIKAHDSTLKVLKGLEQIQEVAKEKWEEIDPETGEVLTHLQLIDSIKDMNIKKLLTAAEDYHSFFETTQVVGKARGMEIKDCHEILGAPGVSSNDDDLISKMDNLGPGSYMAYFDNHDYLLGAGDGGHTIFFEKLADGRCCFMDPNQPAFIYDKKPNSVSEGFKQILQFYNLPTEEGKRGYSPRVCQVVSSPAPSKIETKAPHPETTFDEAKQTSTHSEFEFPLKPEIRGQLGKVASIEIDSATYSQIKIDELHLTPEAFKEKYQGYSLTFKEQEVKFKDLKGPTESHAHGTGRIEEGTKKTYQYYLSKS